MNFHYTSNDLSDAIKQIGIKVNDILFCHSNIGFLGKPKNGTTPNQIVDIILRSIFDVIGDGGTLVVPTFTYSFSQGKHFDPDNSPSDCGIFSEKIRLLTGACRSHDPSVSVAAIGKFAQELTCNIPENSYGEDSFFDRFYKSKGVIFNINFDAGSTFLHYVERCLKAPYRFDKTFTGTFVHNDRYEKRNSTIYVRRLESHTIARFEPFTQLATLKEKFITTRVGRGFVGRISADDSYQLIKETLPERPWLLTQAEVDGHNPGWENT